MTEDLSKLSKTELIKRLQQNQSGGNGGSNEDHEQVLRNIDRQATLNNPHRIPFRVTDDHKNIMLYTALNKRVGPLHPENAKRTVERWKRAGIVTGKRYSMRVV